MKTVVLVDLDGTLTDTADISFKEMKDGLTKPDLKKIPLLDGAIDFINQLKSSCDVFIVSDSHPKYVEKIVNEYFNVPCLSLADKPNTSKTQDFLKELGYSEPILTNFFVVGDTWLDVTLGRGLHALTVLVELYAPKKIEERDGIGQARKHWKSGPTFYAKTYNEIISIIGDKTKYLFSGEAVFQGVRSHAAIRFHTEQCPERFIVYRALARQQQGECDSFAIADKYFEFGQTGRSNATLERLAIAVEEYINFITSFKWRWDYFICVPDKASTQPPNKMKYFFDKINVPVEKANLLEWSTLVSGSTRKKPCFEERIRFVGDNLTVIRNMDLRGKSIIILDDQITTGATADAICQMFIDRGAKNLIFIALFNLIDNVESQRVCPRCGKKLQIKIKRDDGHRFFSCVPPQYKGTGCGFIENIPE